MFGFLVRTLVVAARIATWTQAAIPSALGSSKLRPNVNVETCSKSSDLREDFFPLGLVESL